MKTNTPPPILKTPFKVIVIIAISIAIIFVIRHTHDTLANTKSTYTTLTGATMGTSYHIHFKISQQDKKSIQTAIDKRLIDINQSMSTYDDNSTIMAFNRADTNTPIVIDDDFKQVLQDSFRIYKASQGAFDPTVKPLVDLWGFGKNLTVARLQSPPAQQEIDSIRSLIGLDKVVLKDNLLTKTQNGVELDFSAIAKGYGVDVIANTLQAFGIDDYMVEIGGEIASRGQNANGTAWTIAIDKPINDSSVTKREILTTLGVNNAHIATSGNYRHHLFWQGVQYSHTIDPNTLSPVQNSVPSVTVIHDSTSLADGWATALTAIPFDKALKLANDNNIKALFVIQTPTQNSQKNWQVVKTQAFNAKLSNH